MYILYIILSVFILFFYFFLSLKGEEPLYL